jgi:glycerol-3-phosphate dehydrogenase
VRGVALCGALKNVYAIGLGVIKALGAGDNARGVYIAAAAEEMRHIVRLMGGREMTVYGYAGLADLIATGLSESSRNHQVGCALGKRADCLGSEGSRAALSFSELLGRKLRRFAILNALVRVLDDGGEPEEIAVAVRHQQS